MDIAKLERDGKVAVLVSPGYGAGWSTWNSGAACVFDPDMALAVLGEDHAAAEAIAKVKYPEHYTGGVSQLQVRWVDKGLRFEIEEYDGSEGLRVFGPHDGLVA